MEGSQATGAPPEGGTREHTAAIRARLAEVLGEPPTGEIRRLSGGASRETYLCGCGSRGAAGPADRTRAGSRRASRPGRPRCSRPPHRRACRWRAWSRTAAMTPCSARPGRSSRRSPARRDPKADPPGRTPRAMRHELIDSVAAGARGRAPHAGRSLAGAAGRGSARAAARAARAPRRAASRPSSSPSARSAATGRRPRRTLVHGDFRMGNLMVDGERVTGVLDWELAHIGDPVEDLGWLCVPAWRFARPDLPGGRARHARAAARGLRAPLRRVACRSGGAAPVGARRHAALGGDLRDAGVHAPLGREALGRARGHRPPRVRGRVGPARAARPAAGDAAAQPAG